MKLMLGMSQPPLAITTGSWNLGAPTGNIFCSCCLGLSLIIVKLYVLMVVDTSRDSDFSFCHLRACVAGFTNITFISQNGGLINGAESYVSFSRYSNAVFLPQDPGRGKTTALL
jgi:hypothetical protein